jgi:nucleotide-binding universal stress UspA family protein
MVDGDGMIVDVMNADAADAAPVDADAVPGPVVVGVDESDAGDAALRWAVDEARHRRAPLCVVHAMDQRHSEAFVRANPVYIAEERRAAEHVLATAVEHARACAPDLAIRPVLDDAAPAVALLERVAGAAVVVVGCRGRGGFAGLLLGSTSLHVAMHASVPVVVLRVGNSAGDPGPSAGRVVVGTDGSPQSACAVRFAFERARERGLGLTAVRVENPRAVDMPRSGRSEHAQDQERALPAGCVDLSRGHPEVDLVEKTLRGNAGAVLVEESAGAEMLVVGSRGRGGFSGLLLGSVSHACLHHAHCPVAVVRC